MSHRSLPQSQLQLFLPTGRPCAVTETPFGTQTSQEFFPGPSPRTPPQSTSTSRTHCFDVTRPETGLVVEGTVRSRRVTCYFTAASHDWLFRPSRRFVPLLRNSREKGSPGRLRRPAGPGEANRGKGRAPRHVGFRPPRRGRGLGLSARDPTPAPAPLRSRVGATEAAQEPRRAGSASTAAPRADAGGCGRMGGCGRALGVHGGGPRAAARRGCHGDPCDASAGQDF